MSRLVDADDLKKRLWEKSKAQHPTPLVEHDFRELIEEAPTVDAVEIVRCKNCKWWTGIECANRDIDVVNDEEYCSYGERK